MGCVYIKQQKTLKEEKKNVTQSSYSWDNKPKLNREDYVFENLNNETVGRLPGTVNGQQFIIQNCQNCNLYIFDNINTINVDDCTGCNIFLGPVRGSIFLRDCQDCRLVLSCQQFRARDCKRLDCFLYCATQPCIETCSNMRFGCLRYHYKELPTQFQSAGLSIFNNRWNEIHDFTPVEGEETWKLLPEDAQVEGFLPLPTTESLAQVQISTDSVHSVVPQTKKKNTSKESCLVVFFYDGHQTSEHAMEFVHQMQQTAIILVQTTELTIDDTEAQKLFGIDTYSTAVKKGPVIALEYNGDSCSRICKDTANDIAAKEDSNILIYVSCTSEILPEQIHKLFDFR